MRESFVEADPYRWPYNGDLRPDNTVFLVIDMQTGAVANSESFIAAIKVA